MKSSQLSFVFQIIKFELVTVNSPIMTIITSLAGNMLTNSLKIVDLTKNDFYKLNLAHNKENVGQKQFFADFSSF